MSYEFVLDSSAWIEYFNGSGKPILRDLVENKVIACSVIAVAELADKFERENRDFGKFLDFIRSRASILGVSVDIVLDAAKLKKKFRVSHPKFGLADAIHLATAVSEMAVFVTGDSDFSDVDRVLFVK